VETNAIRLPTPLTHSSSRDGSPSSSITSLSSELEPTPPPLRGREGVDSEEHHEEHIFSFLLSPSLAIPIAQRRHVWVKPESEPLKPGDSSQEVSIVAPTRACGFYQECQEDEQSFVRDKRRRYAKELAFRHICPRLGVPQGIDRAHHTEHLAQILTFPFEAFGYGQCDHQRLGSTK